VKKDDQANKVVPKNDEATAELVKVKLPDFLKEMNADAKNSIGIYHFRNVQLDKTELG
jgi:hypothetical protein